MWLPSLRKPLTIADVYMLKRTFLLVSMLLCALWAQTEEVRVRLYSTNRVEVISLSVDLGNYQLMVGDSVLETGASDEVACQIRASAKGVDLKINSMDYGTFSSLRLHALDTACILCLNPQGAKQRTYEGDVELSALNSTALRIINVVDFETYIAGVVQSEIYGTLPDIFRIQAIISRTWALRNRNKHKSEGFNFCDQVHCQAYLNRCVRPDIMLGTLRSMGETIVDADGKLIETPFHSNSGGQTANSEDVWRAALPYLRSTPDTFSYRMRQSQWTVVIPRDKWLSYFANTHHLNVRNDSVRTKLLGFQQPERQARICGVPLTRVRVDFKLKSTFYDVSEGVDGNVVLSGRGYGHGVGLSQEGTIRMVGLGYSYDSIIRHYYRGSRLQYDDEQTSLYAAGYIAQIEQIIADDMANPSKVRSKKDDWLGMLFRIRNRQLREEEYDEKKAELEKDWNYEFSGTNGTKSPSAAVAVPQKGTPPAEEGEYNW